LYGIRVYRPEAILATHVDRLPLVSSAIIQVAQDLDEPWPVEVYSHDGKAYNVTMLPGDMVLYESHTVLHGRPFALKGRFYANIFVHFKPVDHDSINEEELVSRRNKNSLTAAMGDGLKKLFNRGQPEKKIGGHEQSNHDEAEIRRHKERLQAEAEGADAEEVAEAAAAEEAAMESAVEAAEDDIHLSAEDKRDGRTALHIAAARGDLKAAQRILKVVIEGAMSESDILHARDANQWQAIHEAARGGHLEVLQYLVDMGADVGARTKNGGSVLYWARRNLDFNHAVIRYLVDMGAPDLEEGSARKEKEEEGGLLW